MLATCVMMTNAPTPTSTGKPTPTFSISRYRHSKAPPQPPFYLGGEFLRVENRCFLRDASTSIEIFPAPLFSDCNSGDQVRVSVESCAVTTATSVQCREARIDTHSTRACELRPPSPHPTQFAQFTRTIRNFLLTHGLQEIFTPTLVTCPGLEPSLEPFSTEITGKGTPFLFRERASGTGTAYLPTSPEIHLKKALAQGYTDIFELKTCFRKGEFSPHHENEFTMLEWYRGFADLDLIFEDLKALLEAICAAGNYAEIRVTTFKALFRDLLAFDLTPQTSRSSLSNLLSHLELHHTDGDSFNDLFHRLMIERIEPAMREMGALVVGDFPPTMAALAKLTPAGWADRFEFYWNGLEIANAFNEVTDPREQERRWTVEQIERRHLGTSPLPQDPTLIAALESGIPPSGGIALGVERLYMAMYGVEDIRELKLFPTTDLFR